MRLHIATVQGVDSRAADVVTDLNSAFAAIGDFMCSATILTCNATALGNGWVPGIDVTASFDGTAIDVGGGFPGLNQKHNAASGNLTGTTIICLMQGGSFNQ